MVKENEDQKSSEAETSNKAETQSNSQTGSKMNVTLEDIKAFALSHKIETVAALCVGIGLLALFFSTLIGGGIIGLVAGLFLEEDFKTSTERIMDIFKGQNKFKTLIFAALMFCIFFSSPTLILGGLAGVGLRSILHRG